MHKIGNKLEIATTKAMIWFLQRGYGPKCETLDLADIPELIDHTSKRCPSCHANEIIDWLKEHINLIDE